MKRMTRLPRLPRRTALAWACATAIAALPAAAADIDIYGPPNASSAPNVVFLLDNTSNWSQAKQAWSKSSVDAKCNALASAAEKATCLSYSAQIFGAASDLKQGQVQLRALKLVLNELVCSGNANDLKVNIGLSLMDQQSTLSNGHGVGIINFAVRALTGTASLSGSSCKAIIDRLNTIDGWVQDPNYKAPSSASYGSALYEIFKYFGGHTNPTLAGNAPPNGASPVGATGYGPVRYSKSNTLDDPAAFTDANKTTYLSPISASNSCGNNFIVLVGNGYPNNENPKGGDPTFFQGLNYTPPTLSAVTSDTNRYADEWAYFLANTDVSAEGGVQRVFTYAINTYNDKPDTDQGKLLKSMAAVGGVGAAGYLEVGGDLFKLVNGFRDILISIAAVNSVFTATTLPVSTTTQGTFLNQIFVGMFRPDGKAAPRWVGNVKQYQLGLVNSALDLIDREGKSAVQAGTGFFSPLAKSFWTEDSVFFTQLPMGTPASASDLPDGAIVEKGGAAQQLRKANLQGASARNVYTYNGSLVPFTTGNSGLAADLVAWIRGENNVTAGDGMEVFAGSWDDANTVKTLGTTGARHSMHGDVLHSRPVALNYGDGDVMVYYGSNDGFFHAVNGNKSGAGAGQEAWSLVLPEFFDMIKRQRLGTPLVHLPETNSSGGTIAPDPGFAVKDYGMDGPIGVFARYKSAANGGAVSEAVIYPTMRRGGRNVYAIDVTSKTTPVLKWRIVGGSGAYAKLAQTWSMPKPVVFSSSSLSAPVLIMGGGYDPAEDTNGSSNLGNVVYIVNGADGSQLAALATDYSVPSDATIVDIDGDGQPDRAYIVDVRGNLYRIDFPTANHLTAAAWSTVKAVKIADLGGKVFYAPDVVVTKDYVAVLVGTGDREKPLLNTTADNFFMIKDNVGPPRTIGVNTVVLTKADLTRVAKIDNTSMQPTNVVANVNDAEGCYLELATNGEKVVNAPFTIGGITYFGTNRPTPANATTCSADLGEAYAYRFPLFCAAPKTPIKLTGGGLPPSPVGGIVTIDVNGVPTKVPFIIGGGDGSSPFKPGEPKPPVSPIRTRQNWRIDNTNR